MQRNNGEDQYTEAEKQIVMKAIRALVLTVREAGTRGAPSGILYAAFQEIGMTLESYQKLVGVLVDSGEIVQINHVLYSKESVPDGFCKTA